MIERDRMRKKEIDNERGGRSTTAIEATEVEETPQEGERKRERAREGGRERDG